MTTKPYYQDNDVTIYHGDCLEILPLLPVEKIALVSDVPYGINAEFDRKGIRKPSIDRARPVTNGRGKIKGDEKPFDPSHLLIYPIIALFGANHYANKLPPNPFPDMWKWLFWDKRKGSKSDSNSDGELIWTNRKGALRVHSQKWRGIIREGEENLSNGPKRHAAQKPISLMRWVLGQLSIPSDYTVIDPYAGSGSTIRAAKDLGYKAIGIEIEESHCREIVTRMPQSVLPIF